MQQIDIERSQEFRKCIECFLCQDVCHVIRDHEENKTAFAGPRFFARSAELEMHPLDVNDRRELLHHEQGLGKCNITKCCTEVCPEHIKITDNAIIPLKERVVDASYDPVAWLGRKILNRTKRTPAEAAGRRPASGPAARAAGRRRCTASPARGDTTGGNGPAAETGTTTAGSDDGSGSPEGTDTYTDATDRLARRGARLVARARRARAGPWPGS